MKDAKQSKTVYRCDMSDASLFLECYEELNFGGTGPQVLARLTAEVL
jgi:hypothetical protein